MLGKSVISGNSSSSANNRVFVYEVTGLKQNQENDSNNYAIRSSGSMFISVPYSRMNEEMQRIGKMGGTIVSIQTLENFQDSTKVASKQDSNSEDSKQSKKTEA
jgi:phycocyanin-associated rod protein